MDEMIIKKKKKSKICRFCGELDTVDRRKQKFHCRREEQKSFLEWIGYDAKEYDAELLYEKFGQYFVREYKTCCRDYKENIAWYSNSLNLDPDLLESQYLEATSH